MIMVFIILIIIALTGMVIILMITGAVIMAQVTIMDIIIPGSEIILTDIVLLSLQIHYRVEEQYLVTDPLPEFQREVHRQERYKEVLQEGHISQLLRLESLILL